MNDNWAPILAARSVMIDIPALSCRPGPIPAPSSSIETTVPPGPVKHDNQRLPAPECRRTFTTASSAMRYISVSMSRGISVDPSASRRCMAIPAGAHSRRAASARAAERPPLPTPSWRKSWIERRSCVTRSLMRPRSSIRGSFNAGGVQSTSSSTVRPSDAMSCATPSCISRAILARSASVASSRTSSKSAAASSRSAHRCASAAIEARVAGSPASDCSRASQPTSRSVVWIGKATGPGADSRGEPVSDLATWSQSVIGGSP